MGAVTDKVVARDGKPVVRPILPISIGLDHRFVDGYQAATMPRVFRAYLADPAAQDPIPPPPKSGPRNRRSAKSR